MSGHLGGTGITAPDATGTSTRLKAILIVSEDPQFIVEVQERFRTDHIDVRGCMGPANTPCPLPHEGVCPLAAGADLILVDSPPAGAFLFEWASMPSAEYAQRLSRAHPDSYAILSGAPEGLSGPGGEVAHLPDRAASLSLIDEVTAVHL